MAINQMISVTLISIVLLWTNQLVSCEENQINSPIELNQNDGSSVLKAQPNNSVQLKQAGLWPAFLWPSRNRDKPNVFLIGIKPYMPMLPQPVQDAIEQQIKPMTDDMSAQILENIPGAEQMYQQVSDFMDMFSNFGPQSFLGGGSSSGSNSSGGLSSLMSGFGRRR